MKRFWDKVKIGSRTECWEWTAAKFTKGYGAFGIRGKSERAHRVAWMLANQKPIGKYFILHSCDNPKCVNPAHLRRGTHRDNEKDKVNRGRQAGERNSNARLTREDVLQLRYIYKSGWSSADLANLVGMNTSHISKVVNNYYWETQV